MRARRASRRRRSEVDGQRARGGGDNISLAIVKLVEVAAKPPQSRGDFPKLGV